MKDVCEVLAKYSADYQSAKVVPLGSAGGMSGAQFWRVTFPERAFILRRWPVEHPSPERLSFIHAILRHAAVQGCDILPVPVTTQSGETFVAQAGYLFELAPWMPGAADFDRHPTSERLRAAMRALARFHGAVGNFPDVTKFGIGVSSVSPAPMRHLARLRQLGGARVAELSSIIDEATWPEFAALARQLLASLPAATPRAISRLEPFSHLSFRVQPCLRDIWHDHVLFTGDEVSGLVDFGAIDIDTPATDIARLLGSLTDARENASQTWAEGIRAYESERSLSDVEVRAAYALDVSAPILAGCNWIHWIHGEGRVFDDRPRVLERFRRILAKVQKMSGTA